MAYTVPARRWRPAGCEWTGPAPRGVALALLAIFTVVGVLPAPAAAEPTRLLLQPGSTVLGFRAYGFGLLPVDGQFGRFRGTLTLDPADPAFCRIELEAEAASLTMPTEAMTEDALGPDLLNVAVHPRFAYAGPCRDGTVDGSLTLGGVTRPFRPKVEREPGRFVATGLMRRADWGMDARPNMAGPEVRLRITTTLPAAFR